MCEIDGFSLLALLIWAVVGIAIFGYGIAMFQTFRQPLAETMAQKYEFMAKANIKSTDERYVALFMTFAAVLFALGWPLFFLRRVLRGKAKRRKPL